MGERVVALFEGNAESGTLRLIGRTRDPAIVREVGQRIAIDRRAEAEALGASPTSPEAPPGPFLRRPPNRQGRGPR